MSRAASTKERPRESKCLVRENREAHSTPTTGGDEGTVQTKDDLRLATASIALATGAARGLLASLARAVERDLPRCLFYAVAAVIVLYVALSVDAEAALAQEGGGGEGGDAISQTLTNVRNYLAGLAFGVGGIGFVASLLVKGYASINENAHAYAAMGMKGSLWCIVAGAIVTPILSIASGLAAGGGG